METVYIETSVISYLTSRPSRITPTLERQRATALWWERARVRYRLVISEVVDIEIAGGDSAAASRRMAAVADLPRLDSTPAVERLAVEIIRTLQLPKRSELDGAHLAFAIIARADYLVTWNFRHIANPTLLARIEAIGLARGTRIPLIRTPMQLLGT